ncbi:MAG: insulinase family protein [Acidobacteria bacterium]|nr:insulinase family protein [Acidobacteriota bacterium]
MTDLSFTARTKRIRLSNGITVLLLSNPSNPTISMSGYLKAGAYFNPSDNDALSTLTASMLNKGTKKRTKLEIAESLDSTGARLGISANTFTVSLSALSLTRDLPLIVSTMAEELREPVFPADELEKLKQRIIASIKEDQDETRVRAYERMTQLVYPVGNPFYCHPAETVIEQVERTTTDHLREFYASHYGPESVVLTFVGDLNPDEVIAMVDQQLGDWTGPAARQIALDETPLTTASDRDYVSMKDKANCDVVIGHASRLRRTNPDYLAAIIANRALGQSTLSSRLGLKVRDEMGLTYGINSSFSESGIGDGPFTISVTVSPDNIDLAIDTTLEIVRDYIANGIREDELRDEQSSFAGSYKIGLATNSGMANQIVNAELYGFGVEYIDELPSQIAALDKAAIDEAIRKYFHPEVATTVIAGTF